MNDDYKNAKTLGLTNIDRWLEGTPHHPMSERLMQFLKHMTAMNTMIILIGALAAMVITEKR